MKLKNVITLFILTMILLGAITYVIVDYTVPKEILTKEFDFQLVKSGIGFNLDPDKMHFGSICPKCSAHRNIFFNNTYGFKVRVEYSIASDKPISKWFYIEPGRHILANPNENRPAKIFIYPRQEGEMGNYSGFIIAKVYKSLPWDKQSKRIPRRWELGGVFTKNFWEIKRHAEYVRHMINETINNKTKINNTKTN